METSVVSHPTRQGQLPLQPNLELPLVTSHENKHNLPLPLLPLPLLPLRRKTLTQSVWRQA